MDFVKGKFNSLGDGICDRALCNPNRKWVAAVAVIVVVLIIVGMLVYFLVIKKDKMTGVRDSSLGGNFLTGGNMPLGQRSRRSDLGFDGRSQDYLESDELYPASKESMTGWREGPVFNVPVDAGDMDAVAPAVEGFAGSSATYSNEDELARLVRY